MFDFIVPLAIESINKYFVAYNDMKNKLKVKLTEKKERNIIKKLSYILLALDGNIPTELFEELGMDEEEIVDGDEELKSMLRKFDKTTMKKIHSKTLCTFKKDSGTFVRKIKKE